MYNYSIALFCILWFLIPTHSALAQAVYTMPTFPQADDQVVLYYNSTLGNSALQGTAPIFIHVGAITNYSATPVSWQHVPTIWGTAAANALLSFQGASLFSYDFGGETLSEFFGLLPGEQLLNIACVFRNATGSIVGRNEDGSDFFLPVFNGSPQARWIHPTSGTTILSSGDTISLKAASSEVATFTIRANDLDIPFNATDTTAHTTWSADQEGYYTIIMVAQIGEVSVADTLNVIAIDNSNISESPPGTLDGISYLSNGSVRLQLFAPNKSNVFVVGDFNNWQINFDYQMYMTPDSNRFWIDIPSLQPGVKYGFHYHIFPDNIRIPDAYAEMYLMRWDDPFIPSSTYPNIPTFPVGLTSNEPVAIIEYGQSEFVWTDQEYSRPNQDNLIIYELLIRDFSEEKTFQFVHDSLEYFSKLGVNAIQLMPIIEFPGNSSWGYNNAMYFAPDKAYGTSTDLKELINAAHQRGIAIIMDVAFNHADRPNPFLTMYWDGEGPSVENPWFNRQPTHSLNWFYDWNHESPHTQAFVKRFMDFWVQEYHIDGWRWDFTQGMTQTNTIGGNPTAYDPSRIAILLDYAHHIWNQDSTIYMILEHWCENTEEMELANNGFMLWGNICHDYQEAAMGYGSNFSAASYQQRGWERPGLITYMESHDEERLMYKNIQFGNSAGTYNLQDPEMALRRMELTACFHIPVPGPKMLWQFGELGYDYSINHCEDGTVNTSCRTDEKPVRWDYYNAPERKRLYQIISALHHLKLEHPVFRTTNFEMDVNQPYKIIRLYDDTMNAVVLGNFAMSPRTDLPLFPHTGWWYEYFTGDSLFVQSGPFMLTLIEGEYRLYTDVRLTTPAILSSIHALEPVLSFSAYPNPFTNELWINGPKAIPTTLVIFDVHGREVYRTTLNEDNVQLELHDLPSGMYTLRMNEHALRVIKE